ncbi:unnamed protein product [Candida verbasci]|uniref:Uncharacterized protein n=1 Tax=Candida verbasci TaxID=1227364 RepID=A0A9W4XFH9_9ASCO|nr:unnamed protein product [Candida verbasci]
MGWFGFSSNNKQEHVNNLPPTTIEQRSHDLIKLGKNISLQHGGDIETTLNQLQDKDQQAQLKIKQVEANDSTISNFISGFPQSNVFIIDGEKESKESIICTNNSNDGGKTCLKLKMNSIELFKTMQKFDYFCSLPDDIDATYFECRKIK